MRLQDEYLRRERRALRASVSGCEAAVPENESG